MAPPRYIFAVFPSKEGILISGAVAGYVAGMSNSKSNSYFMSSCTYQHFPDQCVPSLFDVIVNQSESVPLLICMYLMRACNSCMHGQASSASMSRFLGNPHNVRCRQDKLVICTSFKRFSQSSLSRGPALVCTGTCSLLCWWASLFTLVANLTKSDVRVEGQLDSTHTQKWYFADDFLCPRVPSVSHVLQCLSCTPLLKAQVCLVRPSQP